MKKVVLASLLVVSGAVLSESFAFAQQSASGVVQMSQAESAEYNYANTQTTEAGKAAAFEAYIKAYPNSAVKEDVLNQILFADSQIGDQEATLNAADRLLAIDPHNLRALAFEVYYRRADADKMTDSAAKQAALDKVAQYALKGMNAPKPMDVSDADFATLKAKTTPIFESAIADDNLMQKDNAEAQAHTLAGVLAAAPETIGPAPAKYQTPFLVASVSPIAGNDECGLIVATNGMLYNLAADTRNSDFAGCSRLPSLHSLAWGRVRHSRVATFLRESNTADVASDYVDLIGYGTFIITSADAIGPDWGQ